MSKINWDLPKQEYITNPTISLGEVAKKYSVSKRQVERVASDEDWVRLREEMSVKVQQKVGEKAVDVRANKIIQATNRHIQIGQAFQGAAIKAIKKKADGGLEYEPKDFNDARLAAITGVLMERQALGLDNKNINIEANVDGRKMYIVLPQKIKPEIPKSGE